MQRKEAESRRTSMKRRRTRYNSLQIQRLERIFLKTHYPDSKQMENLSLETNIPVHKLQIWFQNRRAKWRKNSKLKNFGGLGSVKETEYVPAPHMEDTLKPFCFDIQLYNYKQKIGLSAGNAIDLRKVCLNDCEVRPQSMARMPEIYDKSSAYKKSGGITSIGLNDNHINPFEYPTTYYRHNESVKSTPAMASIAFASNPSMTSLLFAPIVRAIHSDECDSDVQNTYFNK